MIRFWQHCYDKDPLDSSPNDEDIESPTPARSISICLNHGTVAYQLVNELMNPPIIGPMTGPILPVSA